MQGSTERGVNRVTAGRTQNEIERGGRPRTLITPRPLVEGVSPETPNLWGLASNLIPMVADEEEVVTPFSQASKLAIRDNIEKEDMSQDLGRYDRRYVQQRISSTFELNGVFCARLDSPLQVEYGAEVNFCTHAYVQYTSAS